jgi:hypothetical protein
MQETDIEARHAAYMLSAAYAYIEAAAYAGTETSLPLYLTSLPLYLTSYAGIPDLSTSLLYLVRRYLTSHAYMHQRGR